MLDIILFIVGLLLFIFILWICNRKTETDTFQGDKEFREKYCDNQPTFYTDHIVIEEKDVLKEHNKDYAFMVFDCETTGIPKNGPAYIIQLSWLLLDKNCNIIKEANYYIKPPIPIPQAATDINHITNKDVETKGSPLDDVLIKFHLDAQKSYRLVAHNFKFDADMVDRECQRLNLAVRTISNQLHICTMEKGKKYCQILRNDGSYKFPKLIELAKECKVSVPDNMHNSMTDVHVTAKCLKHMLDYYVFKVEGIDS